VAGQRARRIANEWAVLTSLAPAERRAEGDTDVFTTTIRDAPALVGDPEALEIVRDHDLVFRLPRFFPTMPVEVFLARPVFHPNVHPRTGFVCLWKEDDPGNSVADAIVRLRLVISWRMFNESPVHVMQEEAVRWYRSPGRSIAVPLR
jgi:ubiquitin-protein ligase